MNPLKKKNIRDEIFFWDNIEWSCKNLWKIISADVKANIKQQEIKDLMVVSYKSL